MKRLFAHTQHSKWFVTPEGEIYAISAFRYNKKIYKKRLTLNVKRGYLYVRTTVENHQVHRLVAKFFIKNPKKKPCVNHKDGNKLNNNVKNLEWVTHKENTAHAIKNGLIKLCKKNGGTNLKYSNNECADVLARIKKGMTYKDAGEKYNMPYSTVAHLVRGSRRQI